MGLSVAPLNIKKVIPGPEQFSIFQFPIIHSVCPPNLHTPLFLNAPGSIEFSQEHFKTISYAKFGEQTECIMGNWKIVNRPFYSCGLGVLALTLSEREAEVDLVLIQTLLPFVM